jgi:hypothetical protein
MNSLTLRLFWLLLCIIGLLQRGVAQGCGVVMTKNYNVYNTESVSSTHTQGGFSNTVVYTSVLTDGYATCQPTPVVHATPRSIHLRRTIDSTIPESQ